MSEQQDRTALGLVQDDKPEDFNRYIATLSGPVNLSGAQFRGYDLRKFNLKTANLSHTYLKNSDIRGLDLSKANLAGASMRDAKISGCLFPETITPEEIRLSIELGTRLRCSQYSKHV